MVRMQSRHHAAHVEATAGNEGLNFIQYLLRPIQLIVIGYHNHSLATVLERFDPALGEQVYTSPVIACPPRRVRIEALEDFRLRKSIKAVVQDCLKILKSLFVSESIYC